MFIVHKARSDRRLVEYRVAFKDKRKYKNSLSYYTVISHVAVYLLVISYTKAQKLALVLHLISWTTNHKK